MKWCTISLADRVCFWSHDVRISDTEMIPVVPISTEIIDSLVAQGIELWRDFLLQETIQSDNYKHQFSSSLGSILQSLHTLVSANCSSKSLIDDRCCCRLQAFCYLIKGVGHVVTLTSSTVMSPTSHEQMVTLRHTGGKESTNISPMLSFPSLLLLSEPLRDLRTVPLPRSHLTAHNEEQPITPPAVDTQWLALDILERLQYGQDKDSVHAVSDSSASMLCIETARIWTDLSSSSSSLSMTGGSRGFHDIGDVDCLWAHGALAMLHDLSKTTTSATTTIATTTTSGLDDSELKAAAPVVLRRHPLVLSSAACVAMLSTALHLVDCPSLPSQALGSMLLWELLACHSSSR